MPRMQNLFLSCAVALLVACSTPGGAPGGLSHEAKDRFEMLAALDASTNCWNQGNLKCHLAIYDESVTVMTKSGPRPSVGAIEASFSARYFKDGKPKQALAMQHPSIRMLSPDAALMTGRFVLSGGGLPELSGWFSLVWVRTPAGWRVVHDHTS